LYPCARSAHTRNPCPDLATACLTHLLGAGAEAQPTGTLQRRLAARVHPIIELPVPSHFGPALGSPDMGSPSLAIASARPIPLKARAAHVLLGRPRAPSAAGPLAEWGSLNCGLLPLCLLGARHRASWQLRDVCRDLTWLGQPDLVPVLEDVLHSTSELSQPEWLAQNKGVQHERADQ